jgi:NitT/TauT family transport system substrate-binding protein
MYVTPEVEASGFGGVDMARLEKSIAQTVEGFGLKPVKAVDLFTDKFLPEKDKRLVPPAGDRKPLL